MFFKLIFTICRPLDSYSELLLFLKNPPPWKSLCQELQPHSKYSIRNKDLINKNRESTDFVVETFCHIDPDAEEDVARHEQKKLPKTLVCHDMANGYHDDSIIDGTGNCDAYTFYNWAGIDIFCYFSHHLITIPPVGWINVGHAHGVKVIGTVITEWAVGMAFWDKLLESELQYKEFAGALVALAKMLKFDGWLLNIENKIQNPAALLDFVKYLHESLHSELVEPVLIWYDSVTVEGHLTWQNALNHKNKAFFDACDGLFTNYSWKPADVAASAAAAGARRADLYVGLDVWGRNFYGGGKLNLHEAIKVAYEHGCSLAIFAPAWTHEAITTDKADVNTVVGGHQLALYEQFLLRERALWDGIWPYLNTRLPAHLPFRTSFCRGQGKKRRLYGEVLCPGPWYNLRHMQYQPNSAHGPHGYSICSGDEVVKLTHGTQTNQKDLSALRKVSHLVIHNKSTIDANDTPTEDNEVSSDEKVSDQHKSLTNLQQCSHPERLSVRKKIKNWFVKYIFRSKGKVQFYSDTVAQSGSSQNEELKQEGSEKRTESSQPNQTIEVVKESSIQSLHASELDESRVVSSGKSMVQVSVAINLGAGGKTKYGLVHVPEDYECLQVYYDDSFIGGSCLKVNPSDKFSLEHRLTRIFHCDFYYEETLIVCVVTKKLSECEDQFLNLKCHMVDSNQENCVVNLIGHSVPGRVQQEEKTSQIINVYPLMHNSEAFQKVQRFMLLNEPGFYVGVENPYKWIVSYYRVMYPCMRVTSINCSTGLARGPILLGHLALCPMPRDD